MLSKNITVFPGNLPMLKLYLNYFNSELTLVLLLSILQNQLPLPINYTYV